MSASTETALAPLAILAPNLPGVRCEACRRRGHVSAYRRPSGRLYLLCWMCAARFSARLDGVVAEGATIERLD